MTWRPNRKQRLAILVSVVLVLLCLLVSFWSGAVLVLAIGAVAVWQLNSRAGGPENIPVRSVRCGACGAVGEPHWARCPKCGAADWKTG